MPPTASISGILAPRMVPVDARGEIDEEDLARSIDELIDRISDQCQPTAAAVA
jgi:dihydrodipicolinate synthase/N-acetylneuraminate lyase